MASIQSICDCACHKKYGDKSICGKCVDRHKTSPYYQILKKFD
ncbi:hypothetical protein [Candidatus Nitrososphaera gargensis]|nr:hypothetical protein [Candidatus Nitrososphaera gargensis]